MNLLSTDEKSWASFALTGRLSTCRLSFSLSNAVDLDVSTLYFICLNIVTLTTFGEPQDTKHIKLSKINIADNTITLTLGKLTATFDTIAFLTQAAPSLVSVYRNAVANRAGEWR